MSFHCKKFFVLLVYKKKYFYFFLSKNSFGVCKKPFSIVVEFIDLGDLQTALYGKKKMKFQQNEIHLIGLKRNIYKISKCQ